MEYDGQNANMGYSVYFTTFVRTSQLLFRLKIFQITRDGSTPQFPCFDTAPIFA